MIAESLPGLVWLKVLSKIDLDWMNSAIGVLHRCLLDTSSTDSSRNCCILLCSNFANA
jgi:hypothetical protein